MKRKEALHTAILDVDVIRVQSLLEHAENTDRDFLDDLGSMLHMTDNPEIGQLLLTHGADANAKNARSQTPLFTALRKVHRNPIYVHTLLEHKADVNFRDSVGNTALHIAVGNPRYDLGLIKSLVEKRADVNAYNRDNDTPLHVILRNSNVITDTNWWIENSQCSEPLRRRPAPRTEPVVRSRISNKAFDTRLDVVKLLLEHGSQVNLSNNKDGSPLHVALANTDCDAAIVFELLNRGARVMNAYHFQLNTPLHVAVQNCKTELRIVKALLERGADVNARNQNSSTPLHLASKTPFLDGEILQTLLQYGADVKAKNCRGNTAMHFAAQGNPRGIPTLLRYSTPAVNEQNNDGDTPLMELLKNSTLFPHIVRDMIAAGAEVNVVNYFLQTPLHYAVFSLSSWKVTETCKLLGDGMQSVFECVNATLSRLELKPRNCSEKELMRRERFCETKLQVVKELLKHNADVNAEDQENDTPFQIAVEQLLEGVDDGCCPKLLIKYAALKGPGDSYHTVVNMGPQRECVILSRYLRMCLSEVNRMKNTKILDGLTLHDLVSGARLAPEQEALLLEDPDKVSDLVFERLLTQKYHLYFDVISDGFERKYLVDKFSKLKLQSMPGSSGGAENPIVLNADALSVITNYLTHADMLRFVLTLTNVDSTFRPYAQDIRRHMEWLCEGRPSGPPSVPAPDGTFSSICAGADS